MWLVGFSSFFFSEMHNDVSWIQKGEVYWEVEMLPIFGIYLVLKRTTMVVMF